MTDSRQSARVVLLAILFAVCLAGTHSAFAQDIGSSKDVVFERDVRPIFIAKCGNCHGDKSREANLDLRSVAAMRRGGDSGPALPQTDARESLLFERIEAGDMPPEDEPQLTNRERDLIRRWLSTGAHSSASEDAHDEWTKRLTEARRFWAFQPLTRPPVAEHGSLRLVDRLPNKKFTRHSSYYSNWNQQIRNQLPSRTRRQISSHSRRKRLPLSRNSVSHCLTSTSSYTWTNDDSD